MVSTPSSSSVAESYTQHSHIIARGPYEALLLDSTTSHDYLTSYPQSSNGNAPDAERL
jgi:hypothetical protein